MEFLSFITNRNRGRQHSGNGYPVKSTYNPREKESNWIFKNMTVLKQKYQGQWIIVEGEKLIAAAEKLSDAIKKAKALGINFPYAYHLISEDHANITP